MNRFASYDGLAIAYEQLGSGPVVLMHHGFASESRTNWVRPGLAQAVADSGHSVVLIDARGHGDSDKPHDPAAYRDDAMARDVRALLDHLGVDDVHFVGYSMGAFVGVTYASAEEPDHRLRSLFLGGAGRGQLTMSRTDTILAIAEALEADDKSSITDARALAFRNFADATHADRLALAAIQRSRAAQLPTSVLARISVPALVVNGEDDTLVGDRQSLAEAIPGARCLAVPGDHLSAVTKPEFRAALVDWLGEVTPL